LTLSFAQTGRLLLYLTFATKETYGSAKRIEFLLFLGLLLRWFISDNIFMLPLHKKIIGLGVFLLDKIDEKVIFKFGRGRRSFNLF